MYLRERVHLFYMLILSFVNKKIKRYFQTFDLIQNWRQHIDMCLEQLKKGPATLYMKLQIELRQT